MDAQGEGRHQSGGDKQRLETKVINDQLGHSRPCGHANKSRNSENPKPLVQASFRDQIGDISKCSGKTNGKPHPVDNPHAQQGKIESVQITMEPQVGQR